MSLAASLWMVAFEQGNVWRGYSDILRVNLHHSYLLENIVDTAPIENGRKEHNSAWTFFPPADFILDRSADRKACHLLDRRNAGDSPRVPRVDIKVVSKRREFYYRA